MFGTINAHRGRWRDWRCRRTRRIDRNQIADRIDSIYATTLQVLQAANEKGVTALDGAENLARHAITSVPPLPLIIPSPCEVRQCAAPPPS
jgi:hypothetical protein